MILSPFLHCLKYSPLLITSSDTTKLALDIDNWKQLISLILKIELYHCLLHNNGVFSGRFLKSIGVIIRNILDLFIKHVISSIKNLAPVTELHKY